MSGGDPQGTAAAGRAVFLPVKQVGVMGDGRASGDRFGQRADVQQIVYDRHLAAQARRTSAGKR
jgi:GMP synthase PP-ATPase subunit